MDFKQINRANSTKNESTGRETGECVEEPMESSIRGMFDLPLDAMQEMTDERDRFSPDLGFSPGRSYGGMMLSPSDSMYYDRQREVMYSPSADNYPYSYTNENNRRPYSGIRMGAYYDSERDYGGLGYQGADYGDSNSQYDTPFRSGLGGSGNRWDGYRDRYGNVQRDPLSPRYMDGQRWGEVDEDRFASPSLPDHPKFFGRSAQQETESYPSSYTYGMPYQRGGSFANSTYGTPYPPIRERYNERYRESEDYNGDHLSDRMRSRYAYNDVDSRPFSNPSSPTPINLFPVFSDGENYNRSYNMSSRGYPSVFAKPSSSSNMASFGYSSYAHAPYEDRFSPSTSNKYHQHQSNHHSPSLSSHLLPNLSSGNSNNGDNNNSASMNGNGNGNGKDCDLCIPNSTSSMIVNTVNGNGNGNNIGGENDDSLKKRNSGSENGNQSAIPANNEGREDGIDRTNHANNANNASNANTNKDGDDDKHTTSAQSGETAMVSPLSSRNENGDENNGGDENGGENGDENAGGVKEDGNFQINARAIMQNQEERTVVLIRNIPNRYKIEDLSNVIGTYVDEEFQILRLPIDIYTKRNLGYAFVNFSDSHEVLKLFCAMNGKRWPNSNSLKTFYMCYAKKQSYGVYENSTDLVSSSSSAY